MKDYPNAGQTTGRQYQDGGKEQRTKLVMQVSTIGEQGLAPAPGRCR